jgi:hypothetical protein
MVNAQGSLKVKANGEEYTLWVGMSVLADLQAAHGQNVLAQLEPPKDAAPGWMPDLSIVTDLFKGALMRHHGNKVDRWLVDDIIAQNNDVFGKLMGASNPDPSTEAKAGNAMSRGKAA